MTSAHNADSPDLMNLYSEELRELGHKTSIILVNTDLELFITVKIDASNAFRPNAFHAFHVRLYSQTS